MDSAKAKAKAFLKEYPLTKVSLGDLRRIIASQGYVIVEFNHIFNDEYVSSLIDALHLDDMVASSKGFTYADANRRLVFLHEDLSDKEKLLVLAHEEGHIFCGHLHSVPILGKDVMEEHEANEFCHHILNLSPLDKLKDWGAQHKTFLHVTAMILAVGLLCSVAFGTIHHKHRYYGEFYVTSAGNKYHEKECIFVKDKTNVRRLTVREFNNGNYEPCAICLPDSATNTER